MPSDHFSAVASRYAAFRPRYPAALVDLLAAQAPATATGLDLGCGTGQLTIALAERFERVIAVDPAAALIAKAPPHPRVDYRVAPAEATGLPDASVDLAVAAQAAHWFDWPRFSAEIGRVTRPGGLIALVSYGKFLVDGTRDPDIEHYHDVTVGPYWPPGREHVENGYRDLVLPWPAVAAPAIAMEAAWTRDELIGYVSSWSATARMIADRGPGAYDALCARITARWPADLRRPIRWPLTIRLYRR